MAKLERINKWLEALRSEEYNEGVRYLKRVKNGTTYHCVLGTACDLYKKLGNDLKEEEFIYGSGIYVYNNSISYLPIEVQNYYRFRSSGGDYYKKDENPTKLSSLVGMNDVGFSFKEIADIVEQNLENYFDLDED